ncbi:hypothetical protein PM082_022044 [Marasmius tenuissimus]|nr:hypothetical protein PM082_022044 [Marasmius tenuissimus]
MSDTSQDDSQTHFGADDHNYDDEIGQQGSRYLYQPGEDKDEDEDEDGNEDEDNWMMEYQERLAAPSMHNNSKGIHVETTITPILPLGQQRCANARPKPCTAEVFYAHDELIFFDFMEKVVELEFKIVADKIQSKTFRAAWSKRGAKGPLMSTAAYEDMIRQINAKANTVLKITIEELEAANKDGIDLKHPPQNQAFNSTNQDLDDIASLASCRHSQSQQQAPNVTINLGGLDEIKDLLRTRRPLSPIPANSSTDPISASSHSVVPILSIKEFQAKYSLSHAIAFKLDSNNIAGPHCLAYITDAELLEMNFSIGERASIRWAEREWKDSKV